MGRNLGTLIVSASAGTGHLCAGEALRESISAWLPDRRVEHVDILDLAPRWVGRAYGGGFELMASRAPWMWRELYSWTDGPAADSARWGPLARRLLFRAFHRMAASGEWGLVLCTHFLPCQLGARRSDLPPFALVVTDLVLHRYWVQPGVRRYFVATDRMADELGRRAGTAVEVTGIPLAPAFADVPGRVRGTPQWVALRQRLGLDPARPVALLMGGGLGLGVEAAAAAALDAGLDDLQIIVVCGRNEGARARLSAGGASPDRLRVLGHVSNIHELMAAADVVVTKPGGVTTSEALAVGRPLVFTRGVPGHEEANAREVVDLGAALQASHPHAVSAALRRLVTEPARMAAMAAAARAAGRPNAATWIAASVRQLLVRRAAA